MRRPTLPAAIPLRVVAYYRISEDRDKNELGVSRQREDCRALARARGWTITTEYIDNDVSATKGAEGKRGKKRVRYLELMAAVARGEIDRILVYMASRLLRNRRERLDGYELFAKMRVGLVPAKGPELDFGTATGRMVADIIGAVDVGEMEIKSERSAREALQRAQQGRYHGGPKAFGITADGTALIKEESDQIEGWYDLVLAGASVTSVAEKAGWSLKAMHQLLCNARNAGLRKLKGEIYPAPNPPIVSEETWRAAVAIITDPSRRTYFGGNVRRYVGGGTYTCTCPKSRIVAAAGAKHERRYICKKIDGGCGRSWQAEPVDAFVFGLVVERLTFPDVVVVPATKKETPVVDLSREAKGIRQRLDQLGGEFGDDDNADLAEFLAATRRLRERLADIEQKMVTTGQVNALDVLLTSPDPVAEWKAITDPSRQAAIIGGMMVVTLKPSRRGRPGGETQADRVRAIVDIKWKPRG